MDSSRGVFCPLATSVLEWLRAVALEVELVLALEQMLAQVLELLLELM